MEITRLSPDDEVGCADAVAVQSAAAKLDCPEALMSTPRSYSAHLKYGWDGDPGRAFLARDDDGVVVGRGPRRRTTTPTSRGHRSRFIRTIRGRGIGSELMGYAEQVGS